MTTVIEGGAIGPDEPELLIAVVSANHARDSDQALALVDIAAGAGWECLKLPTYHADTRMIPSNHTSMKIDPVRAKEDLYGRSHRVGMPSEFHRPLLDRARVRGLLALTPIYDSADLDFIEDLGSATSKAPELMETAFSCMSDLADRTIGSIGSCSAIAIGAVAIANHLTNDPVGKGSSQRFSGAPEIMCEISNGPNQIVGMKAEAARESGHVDDVSNSTGCGSAFAVRDLSAGHLIAREGFRFVRPRAGIPPHDPIGAPLGPALKSAATRVDPLTCVHLAGRSRKSRIQDAPPRTPGYVAQALPMARYSSICAPYQASNGQHSETLIASAGC